jgi:hypothetical protein
MFGDHHISCAVIGEVTAGQQVWVQRDGEAALLRDLRQAPFTGFIAPALDGAAVQHN